MSSDSSSSLDSFVNISGADYKELAKTFSQRFPAGRLLPLIPSVLTSDELEDIQSIPAQNSRFRMQTIIFYILKKKDEDFEKIHGILLNENRELAEKLRELYNEIEDKSTLQPPQGASDSTLESSEHDHAGGSSGPHDNPDATEHELPDTSEQDNPDSTQHETPDSTQNPNTSSERNEDPAAQLKRRIPGHRECSVPGPRQQPATSCGSCPFSTCQYPSLELLALFVAFLFGSGMGCSLSCLIGTFVLFAVVFGLGYKLGQRTNTR